MPRSPGSNEVIMKRCLLALAACLITALPLWAAHGVAPEWMHALVNVPVPAHDEKTNAVLLYSEENLTVLSPDKFRKVVRQALRSCARKDAKITVSSESSSTRSMRKSRVCTPGASPLAGKITK